MNGGASHKRRGGADNMIVESRSLSQRCRKTIKRGIDIVVAAMALVLLAPTFAIVALLIVIDSPGSVFYRADRVGYRGRPLRMLKFRKMRVDADGTALTTDCDLRLTRVGKWLMRTRLDELPQFWHVLRGEMSLIGPRPEHLGFVARHASAYQRILSVRPGLTGWSQLAFADERVALSGSNPLERYLEGILPHKVALDRLYASRCRLRRDLAISLVTLLVVLLGRPIGVDPQSGRLTIRRRAVLPAMTPPPAIRGEPSLTLITPESHRVTASHDAVHRA
jgi:lipopolysaccharide/colanic/teichoic acid biosynthesis glycosyltransferase